VLMQRRDRIVGMIARIALTTDDRAFRHKAQTSSSFPLQIAQKPASIGYGVVELRRDITVSSVLLPQPIEHVR